MKNRYEKNSHEVKEILPKCFFDKVELFYNDEHLKTPSYSASNVIKVIKSDDVVHQMRQ